MGKKWTFLFMALKCPSVSYVLYLRLYLLYIAYILYSVHIVLNSKTLGPSINNVDVILLNKAYVVMWTSSLIKLYLVNWATKGRKGVKKVQKTDMVHG